MLFSYYFYLSFFNTVAPEVAQCRPYDTKCDVYSFSILLWYAREKKIIDVNIVSVLSRLTFFLFLFWTRELLALQPSFSPCSPDVFIDRVVIKNQRPIVNEKWPPLTRILIPEAWNKDPKVRPDMKRAAIMIRGDLNDMTTDDHVRRRTQHMQDRSTHSIDGGM